MSHNFHRLRRTPRQRGRRRSHGDSGELRHDTRRPRKKLEELFDVLQIDHRNDHNTRDTPQPRRARCSSRRRCAAATTRRPRITEFENAEGFDQLIVTGPIELRSTCAHHLMPIYGQAYIGVLPSADGKIIGLSKYDRIVDHFAARLQIQEELVKQIGNYHRRDDGAARARGAHQRRAHVQDPPRRARQPSQPDGQQRLLRRACRGPRASRASSCRNASRWSGVSD